MSGISKILSTFGQTVTVVKPSEVEYGTGSTKRTYGEVGSSATVAIQKVQRKIMQEIDGQQHIIDAYATFDTNLDIDWIMLRTYVHTMAYDQTPGRFIKILITDGNKDNPRYLGAVSMSSDVITITDRDNYIGWTPDQKLKDKKLNNSAIGSCIMATQPFGYNFLGGKLVAALVTGETVRNLWKELLHGLSS